MRIGGGISLPSTYVGIDSPKKIRDVEADTLETFSACLSASGAVLAVSMEILEAAKSKASALASLCM